MPRGTPCELPGHIGRRVNPTGDARRWTCAVPGRKRMSVMGPAAEIDDTCRGLSERGTTANLAGALGGLDDLACFEVADLGGAFVTSENLVVRAATGIWILCDSVQAPWICCRGILPQ